MMPSSTAPQQYLLYPLLITPPLLLYRLCILSTPHLHHFNEDASFNSKTALRASRFFVFSTVFANLRYFLLSLLFCSPVFNDFFLAKDSVSPTLKEHTQVWRQVFLLMGASCLFITRDAQVMAGRSSKLPTFCWNSVEKCSSSLSLVRVRSMNLQIPINRGIKRISTFYSNEIPLLSCFLTPCDSRGWRSTDSLCFLGLNLAEISDLAVGNDGMLHHHSLQKRRNQKLQERIRCRSYQSDEGRVCFSSLASSLASSAFLPPSSFCPSPLLSPSFPSSSFSPYFSSSYTQGNSPTLLFFSSSSSSTPSSQQNISNSAHTATETILHRYEQILRLLKQYDDEYYNEAASSSVSDSDYDALKREAEKLGELLQETEKPSRYQDLPHTSLGVGFSQSSFSPSRRIPHIYPMLSLNSRLHSREELHLHINKMFKKAKKLQEADDNSKSSSSLSPSSPSSASSDDFVGFFPRIIAQPKIDGVSVAIRYNLSDGHRLVALTRGDGLMGEDITHSVDSSLFVCEDVPSRVDVQQLLRKLEKLKINEADRLSGVFEVRGEVFLRKSDFEKLNLQRKELSLPLYSNPRNSAAGLLRQLAQISASSSKVLGFFAYQAVLQVFSKEQRYENEQLKCARDVWVSSEMASVKVLKDLGFSVVENAMLCHDFDMLNEYFEEAREMRNSLDYETDGVVYKLDDFNLQVQLGSGTRYPHWAVARKFDAPVAVSTVEDIEVNIGLSGLATPVAKLTPVMLDGVKISRATLHNQEEVTAKDIRIGDTVLLRRAGDVIPQIIRVEKSLRPPQSVPFLLPDKCFVCESPLVKVADGVHYRCSGRDKCAAQQLGRLKRFVSSEGFNIKGLNEKRLVQLVECGLVEDAADIFKLKAKLLAYDSIKKPQNEQKLDSLFGWGKKSVGNLLSSIDGARVVQLGNFIYSLSIPLIGREKSSLLASYFGKYSSFYLAAKEAHQAMRNMHTVSKSSEAEDSDAQSISFLHENPFFNRLQKLNCIGPTISLEFFKFFTHEKQLNLLSRLSAATEGGSSTNAINDACEGNLVRILDDRGASSSTNSMLAARTEPETAKGLVVAVTGRIDDYTRATLKDFIESYGGKLAHRVTKKVDMLIVGEDGVPGKVKEAERVDVRHIVPANDWTQVTKILCDFKPLRDKNF